MTKKIKKGTSVTLHYRGTLEDGNEFDSSYKRGEPMTITAGEGQLIAGFDDALLGMTKGQSKTVTIEPTEGYGPRDEEAVVSLEKTIFPEDLDLVEGMTVPLTGPGGQSFMARLTSVEDTTVTADLNHPMAGQDLTFEIEVVKIN